MTEKPNLQLELSVPARRDIAAILKRSTREFGEAASLRYQNLIRQALSDIEADPERPGSAHRPEFLADGARTYHIALSRSRLPRGKTVKDPRHFLLYRRNPNGTVEVARVLHDSTDLIRHIPDAYRPPTS